ncbi:MAG: DUF2189 domain-containing protein [Bauldia sp.]|uniref:DUF2189 domain-containing protein n=1 Tax=Bauldia sp. TaxID=2575872 RepID=UPI001D4F0BB4|nr:DUF2189 domain-containing protein [Bauldia sp.]MCB1496177.1 DUF2189 domain-containing protein [Bauldia sp.]
MASTVSAGGLPAVGAIDWKSPFRWLGGGWRDLWKAPGPCLIYGLALALISFGLFYALVESDAEFWVLALTVGFVFVAPMLAVGLYEAGRLIERGEKPTLARMVYVRAAVRQDVFYLGLGLVFIYLLWGRIAQIVYGLSTYQLHRTVMDFVDFATGTSDGWSMLFAGTLVGGATAYFVYCLVVVSAPMLLDRDSNIFAATAVSFTAVTKNFGPMTLWAAIIAILVLVSAATAFIAFIVVFPWLGLASWRAYRELVPGPIKA